jgi:hypothetical protein
MTVPGKKYRVRFRDWKNRQRLKREYKYYFDQFQRRGLTLPDDTGLKSELSAAFPHLQPKPKGRLNIIAVYHHYNWENFSLKPALEKFGVVRHWDWFDKFNHSDKNWLKTGKSQMNNALTKRVEAWMADNPADVIFMYVSGILMEPQTIAGLRTHGIPLVNLAFNDKEHFTGKVRGGHAFGSGAEF